MDETGDLKKGRHTVGVQRQYTGTAGRIENAQVGVYLGYASRSGHAMIDRELYLPRSWTDDPDRCAAAGVPAGWITADEVYGADPRLARCLEERGIGSVLATAGHRRLPVDAASARTAAQITADLPRSAWQVRSAGTGAHGPRRYAWAWVELDPRTAAPARRPQPGEQQEQLPPGVWSLLVRRNLTTGELAFYRCYTPTPTTLAQLIRVAGQRPPHSLLEDSDLQGDPLADIAAGYVGRADAVPVAVPRSVLP
ncbi:DDE superfamily endonuclease [Geodermatophilus pulveris]|uniref:DDE superfamily endonuclease n=1 Tax=Geodermatophilus pulveris TaxID=1564159 RepID=A0A239GKF6_9ACTN|nr:transposase [Geodermatophilus pulveris]SNS69620.1 DDE superfamily endonuclease [Geodermatophilus pulveris]